VKSTHPHSVVMDFSAVATMDMDGVRALLQLTRELREQDISVLLVNVGRKHIELMRRTGALDELGAANIHRTVRSAVASVQTGAEPSGKALQPS
jgi:anti-anti-sigma regulatory factor